MGDDGDVNRCAYILVRCAATMVENDRYYMHTPAPLHLLSGADADEIERLLKDAGILQ